MGVTFSSFFYFEESSDNQNKKETYNKICNSLDMISNTLEETDKMVKEIEYSLNNPEVDIMEWDYYDTPILETKNIECV